MELALLAFISLIGIFFSAIAVGANSKTFAIFAAAVWIIAGILLFLQGVDTKAGEIKACNEINDTAVNQSLCVSETTTNTYTTTKDIYTNALGTMFIILGLFFFLLILGESAWGL